MNVGPHGFYSQGLIHTIDKSAETHAKTTAQTFKLFFDSSFGCRRTSMRRWQVGRKMTRFPSTLSSWRHFRKRWRITNRTTRQASDCSPMAHRGGTVIAMATFADLDIRFHLSRGGRHRGVRGAGKGHLCGVRERQCFELAVGDVLILPSPTCGWATVSVQTTGLPTLSVLQLGPSRSPTASRPRRNCSSASTRAL